MRRDHWLSVELRELGDEMVPLCRQTMHPPGDFVEGAPVRDCVGEACDPG